MSEALALRAPPAVDDRAARIGMTVFLAGWTMMFGALLVAYLLLRKDAPAWPPPGAPALDRTLPFCATLVLLASNATLRLGLGVIGDERSTARRNWLLVTIALAVAFLCIQVASLSHMLHRGLAPTSGIYAGGFYGLTGFHAAHLLVGIAGLSTLVPRGHSAVRGWALYWHFLGLVWCVFFAAVFT